MDPGYTGPEFDFDRIVKDLMNKVRGINTSLFQEMIINEAKRFKKETIHTNIPGHSEEIISSRHLLDANKH